MSKVFITHGQVKFDYRPAAMYGDLVQIVDRVYSFAPGNAVNAALFEAINKAADDFDPLTDFVLPSGSAIMTGIFFAALASRGVHRFTVLTWNNNDQAYAPGFIDIEEVI